MLEVLGVLFIILLTVGAFLSVVAFCAYMCELRNTIWKIQARLEELEGKE